MKIERTDKIVVTFDIHEDKGSILIDVIKKHHKYIMKETNTSKFILKFKGEIVEIFYETNNN